VRLTLAEIAVATDGRVVGDPSIAITGVATDSRALAPGALFVAVLAARDGHDFVAAARAAGAPAALVSRADAAGDGPAVVVGDTVAALGRLGRLARARFGDRPVLAVTGSSGKTSTKDLLAAALATSRRVTASPASFNNELGVPATLLAVDDTTEALVCELGARGPGHIAALCEIVRPTVGVVTNIGTAHAEMYADGAAGVARAKGELVAALPADGTAVLNAGDPATPGLAGRTTARILTFGGAGCGAEVAAVDLALDDELRPSFRLVTPWGTAAVRLQARGAHQALNAAAAAAAALSAGAPLEGVAAGLGAALLARWRMELARTPAGVTVLNDAYNANPESVAAALDALAALAVPAGARRVAVLGPMAELGAAAPAAHRAVGEQAARLGVDVLVAVGAGPSAEAGAPVGAGVSADRLAPVDAGPSAEAGAPVGAGASVDALVAGFGRPGATVRVADAAAAADALRDQVAVGAGDAVLVKASRVVGLEVVASALLSSAARVPPVPEPAR
jgi:UDP-N-acetylmuramoyl-tripeptide--D-alanyl-D-alanine ligase